MSEEQGMEMAAGLRGDAARDLARSLLYKYFQTQDNYLTRHHIDSFDQFLQKDIINIIKAQNPILLLKKQIGDTNDYEYKVEVFVGGLEGTAIKIGTPTLSLQGGKEVRILFPNEARLRNLTYQSLIQADILIRITFGGGPETAAVQPPVREIQITDFPLCQIPILLQSRYCLLNKKPADFLREAGECPYDQGGYFIVDGSEKVLVTKQEQAFNTLYLKEQKADPKVRIFGSISCLNSVTRLVKRITFYYTRREETIWVGIPFVRKPIPLFVLFRAMGLTSDKEIVRTILPDPSAEETKILEPLLIPSIREAFPFYNEYTAIQYIKTLTKGFSEAHVIDILRNQTFIHVSNTKGARAFFLAECVRQILRRVIDLEKDTDRDDTRNQRCLTSGFLVQMLFQTVYKKWVKDVAQTIDKEFEYNPNLYRGANFENIFNPGNQNQMLRIGQITEGIKRGFKGKWGTGMGEEKSGVLQALSRLSYLDFVSHCRRAVLEFDTGMKLTGPRQLHTSQFGFYCTSETPGGASIGITKNLSLLTAISTATDPEPVQTWLFKKGGVVPCNDIPLANLPSFVPVLMNGGILGFTQEPLLLTKVLKVMKWSGCLPAYASVGFNYSQRHVFIYLDDGRPLRPLIHLDEEGRIPLNKLSTMRTWKDLVLGPAANRGVETSGFVDPLQAKERTTLQEYLDVLTPLTGAVEYLDPYQQNEAYIASFPEHINKETSHLEIHPSTIVSILTAMIPFANHNQSPRNQLSCSQSKQGLSLYATNFQNRFDNNANILCYGEAPLVRTMYYDFLGEGNMPYGQNIVVALGAYTGYNQEDGILFNGDSLQRGLFRNITYRSYEAFEENDDQLHTKTRIAHPKSVASWTDLKPGLDYTKLDERGVVRIGELVDENTVIVGRYIQTESGVMKDASVTPQVWTHGRVESVVVTVNNIGLLLVKIRVTQDRIPELGDKFSNRHGQKGTIGMILRAHDMPRTADGLVPDVIVNPASIPSRMTIAQLLETLLGKTSALAGSIGNGTLFMNEGDPSVAFGKVLQDEYGFEPHGNQYLYNGQTGTMMESYVFIGPVFMMRLKHMVEDKWNARGEGRRERRTHQPTGGRGNQGGLRIGEMERDGICAHGIASFIQETYMKRSDGTTLTVCNGCGTVPIYNEKERLKICPLCDGPVQFVGESANNLEILPPTKRSLTTFSKVAIPYSTQLLNEELQTYMNMGMRYITGKYANVLRFPKGLDINREEALARAKEPLPMRVLPDTFVPELIPQEEIPKITQEDLEALGATLPGEDEAQEEKEQMPTVPEQTQMPQQQANQTMGAMGAMGPMGVLQNIGEVEEGSAFPEAEELAPLPRPGAAGASRAFLSQAPPQQIMVQQQQQQQQQPVYMLSPMNMTATTAAVPQMMMAAPPQQIPATPYIQQQMGPAFMTPGAPAILQMAAPTTQLIPSGFGAAPPTLVVDTGEDAMRAEGLEPVAQSKRRSGSPRNQNAAAAAPRPSAPRPQGQQQQQVPPSVRVNIIKEGS